jgi:hypothetical protein
MKAEIKAMEEKISNSSIRLEDKSKLIRAEYDTSFAKLNADTGIANVYAEKEVVDITELSSELLTAEQMKNHLNEYTRMISMETEIAEIAEKSAKLTLKIELARELPSEILKTATIPVAGLTVKDGIPLINDLPVSNLSEGEKLDLCVDVAISNPNSMQIILLDGTEKLSDSNRERLYNKCKEKGLRFIATRTTNSNELEVVTL